MGGKSSSSSSAQTTYNTDQRLAVGDGGLGLSGNNSSLNVQSTSTTNYLDGGAIKSAFDTTNKAISANTDVFSMANDTIQLANATNAEGFDKLLDAADTLFSRGESLIGQTQAAVADAYGQAQNDKAGTIDNRTIIVLGVAGAVALYAITRK